MSRRFTRHAGAILFLGLAACAQSGGTYVSDQQFDSFRDGKTTIGEVVAALGPPISDVRESDGLRVLGYSFTSSKVDGATFIPVVGMFAGGASAQSRTVIFSFDANGVLTKHAVMTSAAAYTPLTGTRATAAPAQSPPGASQGGTP